MEPKELGELMKVILGIYARQMGLLQLVRDLGASQSQIDAALVAARTRLNKVPKVAYLSSPRPSDLQGLAELLAAIRWPEP